MPVITVSNASFNSKLVRLKASFACCSLLSILRFNSKLVRLKGNDLAALGIDLIAFQFQTGSIKSHLWE